MNIEGGGRGKIEGGGVGVEGGGRGKIEGDGRRRVKFEEKGGAGGRGEVGSHKWVDKMSEELRHPDSRVGSVHMAIP